MVAPLVVGVARTVGTKASASTTRKSIARSRVQETVGGSARIARENYTKDETRGGSVSLERGQIKKRIDGLGNQSDSDGDKNTINTMVKRVKATTASVAIFWSAIVFFVPQILFWMLGIIALGFESVPVINYVIPGQVLYILTYIIIATIGVCTMAYAAWIFLLRRVDCFGGKKGLIFILSMTGYLVIFINFFPWFLLWLAAVMYMQDEEE